MKYCGTGSSAKVNAENAGTNKNTSVFAARVSEIFAKSANVPTSSRGASRKGIGRR